MVIDNQVQSLIKKNIENIITKQGFVLFDFKIMETNRGLVLRVLADYKHGGITLSECAGLNLRIRRFIEQQNYFGEDINIEVFSPGINWNLKDKRDFLRVKGKNVRLWVKLPGIRVKELSGRVGEVLDDRVRIISADRSREVLFADIKKAKQDL